MSQGLVELVGGLSGGLVELVGVELVGWRLLGEVVFMVGSQVLLVTVI